MVEPFSRSLQKLIIAHLDCAEWLRYLLSNRLKTPGKFKGELS
jgi:hypothetical protein